MASPNKVGKGENYQAPIEFTHFGSICPEWCREAGFWRSSKSPFSRFQVLVGGNGNNADGREVDFVIWWLIAKPKYPTVFKMLIAILSIFHGLCVESTVNFMRDVIDKHSGRMSIETYSSFQDIKFAMKAWKFSVENRSVKEFRRDN